MAAALNQPGAAGSSSVKADSQKGKKNAPLAIFVSLL
jgi:hypothetical protein